MSKLYVKTSEALKSLRADQAGVVSFEYIIVAAAVVGAVVAAFGAAGGTGPIFTALDAGLDAIAAKLTP